MAVFVGLGVLAVVNLLVLGVLAWLEHSLAERLWWVTVFAYVPQHFLGLPTVVLLVLAVLRRQWMSFLCSVAAFLVWALSLMNLTINLGAGGRHDVRVMTYNVRAAEYGVAGLAQTIAAQRPDVLCLQEAPKAPDLQMALRKVLPDHGFDQFGEFALLSKHRMVSRRVLRPVGGFRAILETRLLVEGRPVVVYNLHLGSLDLQGLSSKLPLQQRTINNSAKRWANVQALLAALPSQQNVAVIVCGDFNTPPRGALYNAIVGGDAGLQDAFARAGLGLGFTYRSDLSVVRIDHIFYNAGFVAKRAMVANSRASDHRALVVDFVWPAHAP